MSKRSKSKIKEIGVLFYPFIFILFLFNPHLYMRYTLSLLMPRRPPTLKKVLSKKMHCSRRRIYVGDQYLAPVTSKMMGEFLVYDKTDELKWKEGVLECNTFALFFHANAKRWFLNKGLNAAVGTIWTYATKEEVEHAFNFYLLPSWDVIYIEPQTDMERWLDARVKLVAI